LRSQGLLKKGRPVVEGSNRQLELQRKAELREQGVLTGRKGRPVDPNSRKQLEFKRKQEARENGTLKLGRPKMVKVD
jgi:hypothetical protein